MSDKLSVVVKRGGGEASKGNTPEKKKRKKGRGGRSLSSGKGLGIREKYLVKGERRQGRELGRPPTAKGTPSKRNSW